MAYRSILIAVDPSPGSEARMATAMQLARRLDCLLVGVAATGVPDLAGGPRAAGALAEYAALALDGLRDQAQRLADRFRDDCRRHQVAHCEVHVDEGDVRAALLRRARRCDLVLMSQADPQSAGHAAERAAGERLVLDGARPVLFVPHAGLHREVGRRVVVAWDGSARSMRAAGDALPLLKTAQGVTLVAWNEGRTPLTALELEACLDDGVAWLAAHGIAAAHRLESLTMPIAEAILSTLAALDADLLVMGAYGHSRWGERILGGATRGVLQAMTVPVLMSH